MFFDQKTQIKGSVRKVIRGTHQNTATRVILLRFRLKRSFYVDFYSPFHWVRAWRTCRWWKNHKDATVPSRMIQDKSTSVVTKHVYRQSGGGQRFKAPSDWLRRGRRGGASDQSERWILNKGVWEPGVTKQYVPPVFPFPSQHAGHELWFMWQLEKLSWLRWVWNSQNAHMTSQARQSQQRDLKCLYNPPGSVLGPSQDRRYAPSTPD